MYYVLYSKCDIGGCYVDLVTDKATAQASTYTSCGVTSTIVSYETFTVQKDAVSAMLRGLTAAKKLNAKIPNFVIRSKRKAGK